MKKLFLPLFIIILQPSYGQDCKVSLDALAGNYSGECKNGKAEGNGKAVGRDTYEGQFKNGLPNGTGKYTWSNGNTYEGAFSKGMQEGNGTMIYHYTYRDSLVQGYWKKGEYAGKYIKPYLIHARTIHVTSISCKPVNSKFNQIEI